ncbi:MAG: hypothetical protein ACU85V_01640 [Gammaproteobacteria bacterium]
MSADRIGDLRRRVFERPAAAATLVVAMTIALPPTVSAQTVSGSGARDCSAFNFAAERDATEALDSYVAWSQGYLSAFNWANARGRDVRVDAAALLAWLGRYCAANPRRPVYEAVQSLISENAR